MQNEIDYIRQFDMQICMDWRNVKFDWNRARAFLVTAEEGSLSAAARALGLAQPTLGRQVDALEKELGVVLFQRVGRGLELTPSGLELLDHVRAMGDAAGRVSLSAAGQSQSVDGNVCITCSDIYAAKLLPPIIGELRQSHPGITLEIVAQNNTSDLRRREADIAIRHFRSTEPDLVAKKVGTAQARLYATPDYLAQIGNPTAAKGLRNADFIGVNTGGAMLKGLNEYGLDLRAENFPIVSENYNVMWGMVTQGLGIGIVDATIGDAEPLVQRVLPDFAPLSFPIWLVAHREVNTSRRVRVVFDLLARALARA